MSGQQITRKNTGDLPRIVQRHIEQKTRPDTEGDVTHFFPNRIAHGDAERCVWMANVASAVIAHHGLDVRYTRHDAFWSTTETGKEMRFNEARYDSHVRLDHVAINHCRHAFTRCS